MCQVFFFISFLCSSLFAANPAGDDRFAPLIGQLTDLRFVVEGLNGDIERLKDENQKKMNALALQHNEIAANLQREELRAKQLAQKMANLQAEQSSLSQIDQELLPLLTKSFTEITVYLHSVLPFHQQERLAQIKEIQDQLNAQSLPPHQGAMRLWSFLEDELRLSKENAISRQIINLDGQEIFSQVLHLGMVAMFFQTPDGKVGTASAGPRYQRVTDGKSINAINDLFIGIKKQMRSGSYWLPNIFSLPVGNQQEGS